MWCKMNNPDPFSNYLGPYVSDGQLQPSVAFGTALPKDDLDKLARMHDTAYASFSDPVHRMAADFLFYSDAINQPGLSPQISALLVEYGNQTVRSLTNIISKQSVFGSLPGLIIAGVQNALLLKDYQDNKQKYITEVSNLYGTDPQKGDTRYQLTYDSKTFGKASKVPVSYLQPVYTPDPEPDGEPTIDQSFVYTPQQHPQSHIVYTPTNNQEYKYPVYYRRFRRRRKAVKYQRYD